MLAGEKSVRRSQVMFSSRLFARRGAESFFPLPFFFWFQVKYLSPMTNLCIVRVARGTATSTTWAALVLLDRVGGGGSGGAEGHKIVPHVIHVSGAS
jgi:hypothetical protein